MSNKISTYLHGFLAMLGLVVFVNVLFPTLANAKAHANSDLKDETVAVLVDAMQNELRDFGSLPASGKRWTIRIPVTAYSSDPWQTDDTPFITASQTHVRDGIVAANFLPFGTRVRIPSIYGKKEFVVEDRMNKRYYYKMDIWMEHRDLARAFGLKYVEVEVLPN